MTTPHKFTHLELLAYTMYQKTVEKVGVRWWCMKEEMRAYYMEKATAAYESWAAFERAALTANSPEVLGIQP